jgi:hypothetical protein
MDSSPTPRDRPLSTEEATWELAKRLHWKMEHLDPSDGPAWDDLRDEERDFYRLCIRAILDDQTLLFSALRPAALRGCK